MVAKPARRDPLRRILGLGFGVALVFGGTIGVGILRLPGIVAGTLGESHLIIIFWILGGVYALLGASAVAELAAMIPKAGGFYVYARRAFGCGFGFMAGWSDWINNVASLAYVSITASAFLAALWAPASAHLRAVALAILATFTCLHWVGLRLGSTLTNVISVTVGLMLLALIGACFLATPHGGTSTMVLANTAASLPLRSMAMLASVVIAIRAILVTYDGWYLPIYLAEENVDPGRNLPRAIIGGTLLVAIFYVVINFAFLRVLPLSALAVSKLPAADVARTVLPRGGSELVTLISLATVLSSLNAVLLIAPRILLAIGRDGLFTENISRVSAGGTPRVALGFTSISAAILIGSGTFEQIVALAAVLFLLNYICAYTAIFVLRYREPGTPRPYRALYHPATTTVVLVGSVLFLLAAVIEDWRSGLFAGVLMAACGPIYLLVARRRIGSNATIGD
jgi:APA family basic amino acid/polyamine antiporter